MNYAGNHNPQYIDIILVQPKPSGKLTKLKTIQGWTMIPTPISKYIIYFLSKPAIYTKPRKISFKSCPHNPIMLSSKGRILSTIDQ